MSRSIFVALLFAVAADRVEAQAVDAIYVDLNQVVRDNSNFKDKFAERINVSINARSKGEWTYTATEARWTYALRVPGATSMSMLGFPVSLPTGTTLLIGGMEHDQDQITPAGLISRIVPGDTLPVEAIMPLAAASEFRFTITQVFAGYKGVLGLPDSLAYSKAAPAPACGAVNYSCYTDADNEKTSRSVVVAAIAGFACTGTVLNNTGSTKNLIVGTAAHCAIGAGLSYSAGAQQATFYWNAVTPCGQTLQSATRPGLKTTTGAVTLANTGDMWMMRMTGSVPAGVSPYWSGFDGSDAAPSAGSYGIHHGSTVDQQYVYADAALPKSTSGIIGPGFGEPIWAPEVNVGDSPGGASGSGLFSPSFHWVGSLSGGDECGTARRLIQYTRLGPKFATFKPFLDPGNTGQTSIAGYEPAPPVAPTVTLGSTAASTLHTGQTAPLAWSSTDATSCTASGDWSGAKATSGTENVSMGNAAGSKSYTLTCTGAGGSANKTQTFSVVAPSLTFDASKTSAQAGTTVDLTWAGTNVASCAATGDWTGSKAVSGNQTVNVGSTAGTKTYTLTCTNNGGQTTALTRTVSVTTTPPPPAVPTVQISSNKSTAQAGESAALSWSSTDATGCTASGDWAGSKAVSGTEMVALGSTAGSKTYTLSCTGAGGSGSASVSVTVTGSPVTPGQPFVDLIANKTTASVGELISLSWSSSSVSSCSASGSWSGTKAVSGSENISASSAGTHTYTLTCAGTGGGSATDSVTVAVSNSAPSNPPQSQAEPVGDGGGSMPALVGLLMLLPLAQFALRNRQWSRSISSGT